MKHETELRAALAECVEALNVVDAYFRKYKIDATPDAAQLWLAVSNALTRSRKLLDEAKENQS